MCLCTHICGGQRTLLVDCFVIGCLLSLNLERNWPTTLEASPVCFPVLGLEPCTTAPGFSHGFWDPNSLCPRSECPCSTGRLERADELMCLAGVATVIIVEDAPSAFVEDISNGRRNRARQGAEYIQRILSNPICQKSNSLMGSRWKEFLMSQ